MLTKKYFSIAEVAQISCLPAHKLRYIEKADSNIEIVKIRGRRYYTKNNIDYIKKTYSTGSQEIAVAPIKPAKKEILEFTTNHPPKIIFKIDQLLEKFSKLTEQIARN